MGHRANYRGSWVIESFTGRLQTNDKFDRTNEGIAQDLGSMKEASGRINQTIIGLDAINKILNRTNTKFDETSSRLGGIDQTSRRSH